MENLQRGAVGGDHTFVEGIHQHHVCQADSCKVNRAFDRLQKEYGAYELNRRISKREQYRLYDRKWPFDSTAKAIELEAVQDTLGEPETDFETVVASEAVDAFKQGLTARQLEVLELLELGYKPREIASMKGDSESGKWRWHKHIVKKKAQEWFDHE